MINIVSTQAGSRCITGPQKVFTNLAKGLHRCGYPFVVNHHPSSTRRLWVHDDTAALGSIHQSGVRAVVGPNLYVMPRDIDPRVSLRDALYLQPSEWAAQFWERDAFKSCPVRPWAVGIDTEAFAPRCDAISSQDVMVYHKMRDPQELVHILDTVRSAGLKRRLVLYGAYEEEEYRRHLAEVCLVIWHGRHESQGIALQEALACNVPILVCDVTSVSQARGGYPFPREVFGYPVSAAPYFDGRCGRIITDLRDLPEALASMLDSLTSFSPREYILGNLSLEGQAREFVRLWEHWGLSFDQGLAETLRNTRRWTGPPFRERLLRRVGGYVGARSGWSVRHRENLH